MKCRFPILYLCSIIQREGIDVDRECYTYYFDLDSLSVKVPGQQVLNGFDGYDVVISQEEAASYIAICSEAALNSLVFTNASFVCQ